MCSLSLSHVVTKQTNKRKSHFALWTFSFHARAQAAEKALQAEKAASATAPGTGAEEDKATDPFSVSPRIPQFKRVSSISTDDIRAANGVLPKSKRGRTDSSPESARQSVDSAAAVNEAAAAVRGSLRASDGISPKVSPDPSPKVSPTSSPTPQAVPPASTSASAPEPSTSPRLPSQASNNSTGGSRNGYEEEEDGLSLSNAFAVGVIATALAGVAFLLMKSKRR